MLTKSTRHNRVKRSSFTLIELLIVIGLLGALTALILPSLMANREDALGDVCDYNQAGTVRVLKQFYQVYHHYPVGMHNGLQNDEPTYPMAGLPSAQADHMGASDAACPSVYALSEAHANSLIAAGIKSVCRGTGYNSVAIAETVNVVQARNASGAWKDDSDPPEEMTFDGIELSDWETATGTPAWDKGAGKVIVLWIAPTIDWENHEGNENTDWSKGAVTVGIDLEGKCPIPAVDIDESEDPPEFAYYMAYFKVYDSGASARLIGTTCPECGILNP